MKFSRWVFLLATIYGVLALVPMYFQESMVARVHPPAITHAEYYYGFIGVALAWQLAFLLLSRDPLRYRPIMLPAAMEKLTFGIAMLVLYQQQRLAPLMLAAGCIDLLFAELFVLAYWRTRDRAMLGH
jgi:hypothetical protein